jgi:hypothetical protein
MPAPDLLQWIAMSHKSGTLVIKGPRFTKKVLFQEGLIAAVTSNNPREHLGYYLVGWGYLNEDELKTMLDLQRQNNVMLGELLVQTGRLEREHVDYLVRTKTEETIYELMLWQEGDFFFLDDVQPRRDFRELNLPVDHFILEGARRADERSRIAEVVRDSNQIPKLLAPPSSGTLSEVDVVIAGGIDGQRSIEEVALHCRVPEFLVLSFVYRGLQDKSIKLLPAAKQVRKIPGYIRPNWREATREVENALALRDPLEAFRLLAAMREKYANTAKALEAADGLEQEIVGEVERAQDSAAVVELAVPVDHILSLQCSPEEGFALSRVNGVYTLQQILNLLPGSKLYNQLILYRLQQRGIIRLRGGAAPSFS